MDAFAAPEDVRRRFFFIVHRMSHFSSDPESNTIIHPAATVVPLRDGPQGIELLLLRRNEKLSFLGGAWVFPGGRIDEQDFAAGGEEGAERVLRAARCAAVREAEEEAGIRIEVDSLVPISRWIPPPQAKKRFETWFFIAPTCGDEVRIDGEEIHDHRWYRPEVAMAAQRASEIVLAPPTFVTIEAMAAFDDVVAALRGAREAPVEDFTPRIRPGDGGAYSLYQGDVAYAGGELNAEGPRHRLFMSEDSWRYERSTE